VLFTIFTHLLISSTSKNSNIINDIIDYVLCTVLFNKLFIKIILLLLVLWVRYRP